MVVEKKKYIIELPENTHWIQWIMEGTKDHHPYMDYKQVEDLTSYIEPDTDAIRKEAYNKAFEDAEQVAKSGKRAIYQKGLNDAWDAARKIYGSADKHGLPTEVITKIFREDGKEYFNYWDIVEDFSPAEAIEKIQQYEQRQEEEKKESIIAEDIMRQYLNTFCNGRSCTCCPLDTPDFTCGRGYHFISANPISDEEVRRAYVEVRQKMEEN